MTISDLDLRHEIDADGHDAGVELEDLGDDIIRDPFDPRLIDVTTETRTLDTLMKRLEIGQIDLDPDFQRSRGIWTEKKKSQLIESLLLRIPLPTFYVAEVAADTALGEDRWAVVDGIQRLSTIAQFVKPEVLGLPALILWGLQYLRNEEGKAFNDLSPGLRLRILESQFTIQVIRKTTPEPVKLNIFARINTGGMPLSPQELRHALTPGPARAVLRDLAASEAFQLAVDRSVSPSRMADREMVLRFLAFRLEDPTEYKNQDFDGFLRSTMLQINVWDEAEALRYQEEFETAMRISHQIFGRNAFRKRYHVDDPRRPISKALFETVSVAVATAVARHGPETPLRLLIEAGVVQERFMELMADRDFDRAVSQGTGDPARVRYRFEKLIALLDAAASRHP